MADTAVLGLGAMGSGIAKNLAAAGYEVVVWNRTPPNHPELRAVASPRQAAEAADVVISMVRDDEASHAVWFDHATGAAGALGPGKLAIESSTVTPAWSVELSHAISQTGAHYVEAPVAGSRPQLAQGQLVYLLGGTDEAVAAATPFLEPNAGAISHVGAVGQGAAMKLAVNGLLGIQVVAYAELVGFLERSGIERAEARELLSGLPLTSPALQRILGLFEAEDYSPNFPVELVAKDFGYLVEAMGAVGAPGSTAPAALDAYRAAVDDGFGGDDIAGVAQRYIE